MAIFLFCVTIANPAPQQSIATVIPLKTVSLASFDTASVAPLWGGNAQLAVTSIIRLEKNIPLHHFDRPCQSCHNSFEKGNDFKVNTAAAGMSGLNINKGCTSFNCHEFNEILNHPVAVNADAIAPANMPLDSLKKITCLTCHEQQKKPFTKKDNNQKQERLLKTVEGRRLCASCHNNMPGNMKQHAHWQFSTKAHLGNINNRPQKNNNESLTQRIDSESNTCISCHQDVTVTVPSLYETSGQKRMRRQNMKDHPIGMNYSQVATQKISRFNFNYTMRHGNPIRFFDGKVGCGSCHSLYSKEENYLVDSEGNGGLCRKCHKS